MDAIYKGFAPKNYPIKCPVRSPKLGKLKWEY
jgi:hypothetical protein